MNGLRAAVLRCSGIAPERGDLRRYQGEDARLIDWRASARCPDLLARPRALSDLIWSIVVDDSPSMRCGLSIPPCEQAKRYARVWHKAASGDRIVSYTNLAGARDTLLLLITNFSGAEEIDVPALRQCANANSAFALVARDEWPEAIAGRGWIRVQDAQTRRSRIVCLRSSHGVRRRMALRERNLYARFRRCGWRMAFFSEHGDGTAFQRLLR